jgi:uncharacterized protein YjiS (DUF1127 family)
MTYHVEHFTSVGPSLRSVAQSTARLVHGVAAWQRRRQAIRALRQLDDHLLSDIGIGRSEIAFAVRQTGGR